MGRTHDKLTDAELFSELLQRQYLQSAFSLFARLVNRIATELDEATVVTPDLVQKLKNGQKQLAAMWTAMPGGGDERPDFIAEQQLYYNLMESHLVEAASRSSRHRDFFALVVGGPDQLDSLQYVRSESATRWLIGQDSQVNSG